MRIAPQDEFEAFVAKEELSYQRFELPGGCRTPGHDRSYLRDIIFSEDVSGQSVLDVGSYLGYFCIEALRRGATAATGIDPNRESIRKAKELARIMSVNAEYVHADFEHWEPAGRQFDLVLGLNVLHHMYDAVHALRQMMQLAKHRVVSEVARPALRDIRKGWFDPFVFLASRSAAIFLGPPKKDGHILNRSYLFTPAAMSMIFNRHTTVFEPIDIIRSPFKGRYIVSARRRRIKHLFALAGPTGSGKSTLVRRVLSDMNFRRSLGLPEGVWKTVKSTQIGSLPAGEIENLLVEYDLTLVARADMQTFGREPAFHLLDVAEKLTFITLFVEPGRLDQQLNTKERTRLRTKSGQRVANSLMDLYRGTNNAPLIRSVYGDWMEYAAQFGDRTEANILVINRWSDFAVEPAATWQPVYDALYGRNSAQT